MFQVAANPHHWELTCLRVEARVEAFLDLHGGPVRKSWGKLQGWSTNQALCCSGGGGVGQVPGSGRTLHWIPSRDEQHSESPAVCSCQWQPGIAAHREP
jgi:hypothetical protein